MIRVCWCLSGEELAVLPSEELPDVRTLRKLLHERHGAPPRFRQAILENGCRMPDDCTIMQGGEVQLLLLDFVPSSDILPRQLWISTADDKPAQLEGILQCPVDPNVVNTLFPPLQRTPLLLAANLGHVECLDLLLEAGADTEMRADYPEETQWGTPLNGAAFFGHIQCVRSLLSHGADMQAEGVLVGRFAKGPISSLCHACLKGHEDVALFLVQSGAANDLQEIIRALGLARGGGLLKTSAVVQLLRKKRRQRLGPFSERMRAGQLSSRESESKSSTMAC